MKIVFVLSLLINIAFFLWEFNINSTNRLPVTNEILPKQILLMSELPSEEDSDKERVTLAVNNIIDPTVINVELDKQTHVGMSVIERETTVDSEQTVLIAEGVADVVPKNEPIVTSEASVNFHNEEAKIKQPIIDNSAPENAVKEVVSVVNRTESKTVQTEKMQVCYQLGPFKDNNALDAWANLNAIKSDTLKPFKKDSRVISKYLVYYPAADNYQQGKQNVAMLKQKGINDLWLFRKGELKGGVSLGLFVKQSRAIALKDKLLVKEIDVDVMQRYKTIPMIYVKVHADKDSLVTYDGVLISECE